MLWTHPEFHQKKFKYKWFTIKCNVFGIFVYNSKNELEFKQNTTDADNVQDAINKYLWRVKREIDALYEIQYCKLIDRHINKLIK